MTQLFNQRIQRIIDRECHRAIWLSHEQAFQLAIQEVMTGYRDIVDAMDDLDAMREASAHGYEFVRYDIYGFQICEAELAYVVGIMLNENDVAYG